MHNAVGVVVPSFNHAAHLPERLGSIAAQTRAPARLVFLDDASTDASWEVAAPLLAALPFPVESHRNAANTGVPLRQWQAGVARLDTAYCWIAESDDVAEPRLIEALAATLDADPDAVFAFCDSRGIGPNGAALDQGSRDFAAALGETALLGDLALPAPDFLRRCLCPRNLVVNASAVLWRTASLRAALDALAPQHHLWLSAGDWRAYVEACGGAGHVRFVAEVLNGQRRHPGSVTGRAARARQFGEVVAMHAHLRERLGPDPAREALMRRTLQDLRRAWRLAGEREG